MFRSSLGWLVMAVGCAALHVACGTDAGDDGAADASVGASSGGARGASSGTAASGGSSSGGAGSSSSSGAFDAGLDAASDAGTSGIDAASDAGTSGIDASDAAAALDLPGAACSGSLTEAELADLYANKPVTGTPSMAWSGSVSGARTLGPYTSAIYKRLCQASSDCGAWEFEGGEPSMISSTVAVRQGSLYLWRESDEYHLGIVSDRISGGGCSGWTQGKGALLRGESTTVTLATETEHDCQAGTSPAGFSRRNLVDPTGIVAAHCMKLWYSKSFSRTDIGPQAYDEYIAVYDGSY